VERISIEAAIETTRKLLDDVVFMCENRTKQTYFTRSGKLDFKGIVAFILNFVKKSLQLELDLFFKQIKCSEERISKQAFSEARKKINPQAFIKLNDALINWFYAEDDYKTFMGYRMLAIDGSYFEVNNSKKMRTTFGFLDNKNSCVARALTSSIYDVENNMMIVSKIGSYYDNERDYAIELIEKLKRIGIKKDLFLFDRGYPSRQLISYLEGNKLKYVMRVPSNFLKAVKKATASDQIITLEIEGEEIQVRVLRFMLDSGIEEILLTNVMDTALGVDEFKEIYFKRWRIETKYDELKNKLQIENFTGDSFIVVEQDYYASMYLANMIAIAQINATSIIQETDKTKTFKHNRKINTSILIGKLKGSFISILLQDDPRKRLNLINEILREICRNVTIIRPGRSYERRTSLRSNKFSLTRKAVL
jgi:hypothetical protein